NVPEIYMQEFWATAKLHHNSIRFKIDTKKSILDLEAFREMLHISPRIPNQSFADLPTEEEILDFLRTPEESEEESNEEEDQDLRLSEEARIQEEEDADELYRDVNINQGRGLQVTQNVEDTHVTLTPVNPNGPQESSSVSSFVTIMLNPTSDVGVESIFTTASSLIVSLQSQTPIMTPSTIETIKTSGEAPIPPPTIPSIILENLPTFNSAFRFEERLRSLETSFSEYRQTNLFADAVSVIPGIVHQYMTRQMKEAVREMEELPHPVFETGVDDQPIVQTSQHPEWFSQPRKPPSPDRAWNTTLPAAQGDAQSWINDLARQTDARSSFNELLDTPIDFSNFIMNRLNVDTLIPDLLAGPTYELMRGSCTSLTELEYHLEEFYGFVVNRESALDVYSKRRIIAVTELKIMEWHNYKHLDWISIRRDDDKIYKFKEGDLKRLRIQDIEDMLLLVVQGKLTNLTVEERFAFNVSLRMFTRSIIIQRRMEDLQLGVESYQKRLNLTKPDTYRSDLKRREAYTAY
nr:hypothetical protein [Tanacetum cinerariifolium]